MDIEQEHSGNGGRNLRGRRIGQNAGALLALPQSRIARIISRLLFLSVALLLVPHVGPIFKEQAKFHLFDSINPPHSPDRNTFNDLITELKTGGILREGQKSLMLIAGSNSDTGIPAHYADHLKSMGANIVIENSVWPQSPYANESFDIAFTLGQFSSLFVDRVLKSGGAVILPAKDLSSNMFFDRLNYKCVYIKPFDLDTVVFVLEKPSRPDHAHGADAADLRRRPNWRHRKLRFADF